MVTSTLWAYHSSKTPDRLRPSTALRFAATERLLRWHRPHVPRRGGVGSREAITTTCDARGRRHCVNGSKSYNCGNGSKCYNCGESPASYQDGF
ncbi:hypothetical protein N0V85_004368 [Neurospora sp. IMI 360204]|nr:hypothetical protein N0V85_004368 [Neurospora sp. IMI 360204]